MSLRPVNFLRFNAMTFFVGREGVEPSQYHYRRILSPLRLPIPPSPQRTYFTLILMDVLIFLNACYFVADHITNFLRNYILRFIAFDGTGLFLLAIAWLDCDGSKYP